MHQMGQMGFSYLLLDNGRPGSFYDHGFFHLCLYRDPGSSGDPIIESKNNMTNDKKPTEVTSEMVNAAFNVQKEHDPYITKNHVRKMLEAALNRE